MKKVKFQYYALHLLLILLLILISGCEKDNEIDKDLLLGEWVSTDQVVLLDFKSENDLYRNGDHYIYSVSNDSITIQYSGVLYIYVQPTTHHCQLKGDELIIDFRPYCYGFSLNYS